MHLWFKGRATARVGNASSTTITSKGAGIKGDISRLGSHWDNVFMVHHQAGRGVTAEVNLKNKNLLSSRRSSKKDEDKSSTPT